MAVEPIEPSSLETILALGTKLGIAGVLGGLIGLSAGRIISRSASPA
jgi:hypothetical protein